MIATFMRAWLIAWLLGLGTSLGCLLVLMLHHIVRGRWGECLRPALETGARSLPLWALGFVPLAWGIEGLYPWSDRAMMAADASLRGKAWYLSSAGYIARSLVSLSLWSALALGLSGARRSRPGLATFGLILVFLSATLSANDWLASLDPHFSSSLFGLYVLMGQVVAGLSAAIVMTAAREGPSDARSHELGNLLLAALMLWGYVAFSQYLLVWSADLPFQSAWYLARAQGPWPAVTIVVAIARLGLVLPALFFRAVKRHPRRLAVVAGVLLVTYLLELYWLVLPAEGPQGRSAPSWFDLVLPLAVAGAWAWPAGRPSQGGRR